MQLTRISALGGAVGGLLLIAGCSTAEGAQGSAAASARQQCFRTQQVTGYDPVDRDTVDVWVGANRAYRLELFATCSEINWSHRIAIRSRGSSWICPGREAELIVPSSIGRERCLVTDIRRLSDAERDAARRRR